MSEFSKATRKRFVALLREAKEKLWDGLTNRHGKEQYICFAITGDGAAPSHLKDEIHRRLEGYASLGSWLEIRIGRHLEHIPTPQLQAHRLAWINLMIEEFSQP